MPPGNLIPLPINPRRLRRPVEELVARHRGVDQWKDLMPEQRRMIEDFEVIEYVDEDQIASLRKRVDVDVPLDLHWTWEYGSEVEELRALYERGKKGQWNAEDRHRLVDPVPARRVVPAARGRARCSPAVLASMGADDATCRDAARGTSSRT